MANKSNGIYINNYATIVGPMEKNSRLSAIELSMDDYYYGEKSFELAEVKMQKAVMDNLLFKTGLSNDHISLLIGGDLSNQICVSSTVAGSYAIPFLGIYSACATFVESLILASMYIKSHSSSKVICLTSSHNLHAEKQFRFPIEYGAPRKKTTTFTTTGAVSTLLSKEKSNIKVDCYTLGNVIDMGLKDASNMGAIMAPAAAEVIYKHLCQTKREASYYDAIITGDLGMIGSKLLKEYLKTTYQIDLKNHLDAGSEIYSKKDEEKVNAGASGPSALPIYFFHKIVTNKKYHKVLLVATGSLHSPSFINQQQTIKGIAHVISLEVNL